LIAQAEGCGWYVVLRLSGRSIRRQIQIPPCPTAMSSGRANRCWQVDHGACEGLRKSPSVLSFCQIQPEPNVVGTHAVLDIPWLDAPAREPFHDLTQANGEVAFAENQLYRVHGSSIVG